MRIFLYISYALCWFLSGGVQPLSASDFHAILIGDYASQDVRKASAADLQSIRDEMTNIAEMCGYTLKLKVIAGNQPIAKKVLVELKNLTPGKKDVVFFYFSGHGYRTRENGDSPWPNLDFPVENHGISLKGIIEAISQKKARLSIIMADCCNQLISKSFAPPMVKARMFTYAPEENEKRNMKSLFCKSTGVIAIVSSTQGQAAYCNVEGSFYTRSFFQGLQRVISDEKYAKWEMIFTEASQILKPMLDAHQLSSIPLSQTPLVYMQLNQ